MIRTIRDICYWKGPVPQVEMCANLCKICQKFKNIKTLYGNLTPKNILELKPWNMVHVDLIGTYSKSTRKHKICGAIINDNVSLTCMMMIDPKKGWCEICQSANV